MDGPSQLTELVGNTPLLDLSRLTGRPGVSLYGKAEFANPGRLGQGPAGARHGRRRRAARPPRAPASGILDSTSGNTGIAYAMVGAALGIPVTLCLPVNASPERKRILAAYGVELHLTDPLPGATAPSSRRGASPPSEPELYAYLDQYSNPENWRVALPHHRPRDLEQTGGAITHFVTGLGTSGTFMGVGRFLREQAPAVRLISVEPDSPFHGLEGMKHMATAIVPPIYDPALADEARELPTEEAHAMVRAPGARARAAGRGLVGLQRRGGAGAWRSEAAPTAR